MDQNYYRITIDIYNRDIEHYQDMILILQQKIKDLTDVYEKNPEVEDKNQT